MKAHHCGLTSIRLKQYGNGDMEPRPILPAIHVCALSVIMLEVERTGYYEDYTYCDRARIVRSHIGFLYRDSRGGYGMAAN
ncbi:MAG TPA: hypothetical protein VGE97_09015 [Nitrososphaera sp.]